MNPELPDEVRKQIENALFAGRKIEAIKLYRNHTSCGLAEAKTAVEDLEVQLRRTSPERFVAAPAGKGCGGTALLMVTMVLCLAVLILVAVRFYFRSSVPNL